MRIAITWTLCSAALLCSLPTANAQRRGQVPLVTLAASGKVKAVRPQLLLVAVEGGQEWFVSVPTDYKQLSYEATASTRWLRRRMPVQFNADVKFEKRKKEVVIAEPVSELTVAPFTPELMPGFYPQPGNDQRANLFARRSKEVRKKRPEPESVPCLIVGQVLENKEGQVRVLAGNVVFRFQLDPKSEITVQWHDVQWVQPGDKIDLSARYPAGRLGQAQGQQMTITAAKMLDIEPTSARGRRASADDQKKNETEKVDPAKAEAKKSADEQDTEGQIRKR